MAERLSEHPIMLYLTFVMPLVLLLLAIVFSASVFQIMVLLAWLGSAFVVIFLPIASDDGSSS